jgi:hypothetical protein
MLKHFVVLGLLLLSATAFGASAPAYLHYQGYLTDVEGTPVSGDWTISFKFYSQSAAGSPFFAETRDVKPEIGVFSAILGTKTDNPLAPASFQGGEAWLELSVAPKGGQGITLQPRQRVVSHPYALWTSGAEQCKQADNSLSLGGAAPTAYVTLAALPDLCITDATLAAKIEALGLEGYGDAEVAAYLLANGYLPGGVSSWDEIEGKPEDLLTEASAAASGLFLMADGSVVATGDLDLGGNQLLNVVIQNAAAADAPEAPLSGQLWYDTDENILKVYGDSEWISLANATNLACDGCVDDGDVSFPYALGGAKGGAALKALSLECEGCVTMGSLAAEVLAAGNISFDDSVAGLGASTVGEAVETLASQTSSLDGQMDGVNTQLATLDQRVETLENTGPGNVNEGNGTVIPFNLVWDIAALGRVRQNFHIFNPAANPKVLLYLNSSDPEESGDILDKTVNGNFAANAYAAVTSPAKATASAVAVSDGSLFHAGDPIMLYQIVTASDSPAGTWEMAQVKSVVGNTLVLFNSLTRNFTHCGETCGLAQVIRVERFKNFYVESGGTVYPSDDLNGTENQGGIVAIIADTITVKNGGRIHANSYGFEAGDAQPSGGYAEMGHSECNVQDNRYGQSANCSGGGGAHTWWCCYARGGGGGGGNRTGGANGSGSNYGYGGGTKGEAGLSTIHFGGGGGYAYPTAGGLGGGIVILAAKTVKIESGGVVEAAGGAGGSNPNSSDYAGGGGGAGGSVAIFASSYTNAGTVQAPGGGGGNGYSNYDGGQGGEGWVASSTAFEKFSIKSLPADIHIILDGQDITAQVGDPNAVGAPSWLATGGWGNGLDPWSTGELDLTSLGNWTLGRHTLELREQGGAGGVLEMAMYLIYPFTSSTVPENDTCAKPKALEVMAGSVSVSGTTEDTMGRIKATDDYVQAGCGGSGGPDTVYKIELTDWRKLTIDVTAAFTPRVFVRKGDCAAGPLMACGTAQTVTPDLKTGTYYLFVDGDGNLQKGNFKLDITADLPAPASNDTCAGATTLTLDENGKAEVYGVTFFSTDDYLAGCGGTGAKDLVYKIEIPNGYETMRATVETTDFNPVIYMTNTACGGAITCSPTKIANLSWPTAGTYYIIVDGKTAADQGEFTLKVEMIPPE